jgi:hypothetical protein
MGLARQETCDGHVYTVVDDIALTQCLLVAGQALDDLDDKPVTTPLRVTATPAWLLVRAVGAGKFGVALSSAESVPATVNVQLTLEASTYETQHVNVAVDMLADLPQRLAVRLKHQPIRLEGVIFSLKTQQPIVGATVELQPPLPTGPSNVMSVAQGRYRFESVSGLQNTKLVCTALGYQPTDQSFVFDYTEATNVVDIGMTPAP